jgi:hypothetical protein
MDSTEWLSSRASPCRLAKPQVSLEDPLKLADLGSAWESWLRALEEVKRFRTVRCKALKTIWPCNALERVPGRFKKSGIFPT